MHCLKLPLVVTLLFVSGVTVAVPAAGETGIFSAPPAPVAGSQAVERQLQRAQREDSGRGLQFAWAKADVGYHFTSLDALGGDEILPEDTSTHGLLIGAGAGVRFLFLTAGARFRHLAGDAFDLWNVSGEVAFRVPLGQWEPFGVLGVGYSSVNNVAALSEEDNDELSLGGLNTRIAGGIDYFVTPIFSAGVRADAEFLFLGRDAIDGAVGELAEEGSSVGISSTLSLRLGLHF